MIIVKPYRAKRKSRWYAYVIPYTVLGAFIWFCCYAYPKADEVQFSDADKAKYEAHLAEALGKKKPLLKFSNDIDAAKKFDEVIFADDSGEI